jgi:serine/threonine protein kinase
MVGIEPGTLIAKRYRVQRQLGKRGMGEVFAAENTRTGRAVALKVLRAEAKAKATAIERFRREARAAGAIRSDHVTQVLDVEDDPEHGIVLVFELLEGESLVERLKRTGPIPFAELWSIVESVWSGLTDAHTAGVVHRDLKPSNVFLQRSHGGVRGRVKILDFGISKLPKKITTQSLTQVGQSLGTFSFMPPEQIGKAKMVDHRADIYACTTLIYQGLSGQLPYQAKNVVAMMELKSRTEPRTLGEAMGHQVDARLEAFIARGLARNPDQRFQTAVEALEAWRTLRPAGAASTKDGGHVEGEDDAESQARTQVRSTSPVFGPPPSMSTDSASTDRYVPADRAKTIPQELAIHPTQDDSASVVPTHPQQVQPPPYSGSSSPSHGQFQPPPAVGGSAMSLSAPSVGGADIGVPPTSNPYADPSHFEPVQSDMHLPAMAPQQTPASDAQRSSSGLRVAVGVILGAVGLMLLGFGIVALALRLLR